MGPGLGLAALFKLNLSREEHVQLFAACHDQPWQSEISNGEGGEGGGLADRISGREEIGGSREVWWVSCFLIHERYFCGLKNSLVIVGRGGKA